MKRILLASLLVAAASQAGAQQAGSTEYAMSCAIFHHNPDGTWNTTRSITMQTKTGTIGVKPSYKFRAGTLFSDFDLAAALDRECPH